MYMTLSSKEISLIRSAFLTLLIVLLFALLISYFCGPLYGLVTAIVVSLLSIKILIFHDAETNSGRIDRRDGSIVMAFAVGILVGIIHGLLAGKESIYCGRSYELLAEVLAFIAMILLTFIKTIIDTIYNIYREK